MIKLQLQRLFYFDLTAGYMINNRQLFLQHVAQTSPAPLMLEMVKAEGVYLTDSQGKKYLDLIAGIAVSNVGHSHPAVVEAVKQQAESYMHLMVYGELIESPQVKYAQLLAGLLPYNLNSVYFTNSGAEATEGAMKLAKRYNGRTRFVSFKKSYHGSTQGALSLMGDEYFKQNYRPLLPDIQQLTYNDVSELEKISCRTAAVVVEPIQAESGVTVPDVEFMQLLQARCRETGALLIVDEAQTAFGRTGKLFGFEHFGITPDILLLAKAFGGGMPLGAFIADKRIMQCLTENPVLGHITTFGGHPVCCAAGQAALNVLLHENWIAEAQEKGDLFKKLLVHPAIRKVQGIGLMRGVEFDSYETNKRIIDRCIELGVFTDWFLFAPNYMRIAPPLCITKEEIKHACSIILQSIES